MFNKNHYQENFSGLTQTTSEEILYAIEVVTGESFETETIDMYGQPTDDLEFAENDRTVENAAMQLYENGGREDELLAALPTENADEGDKIYWGNDTFAEFDGEKWTPHSEN